MKSTEIVDSEKINKGLLEYSQKRSIIFNLVYFTLGVFISKASVFGEYSPFGASLVAAIPYKNLLSTVLGTIIGYLLPSEINMAIRYIVSVISISLIRWTLNDLKKIKNNKLYSPIISGIAILVTGMVVNSGENFWFNFFSYNLVEAVLSGTFSYFFKETVSLVNGKKNSLILSQQELACAFISLWILILSLSSIMIGNISIGRVISIVAILFSAKYLGITGGSVAGISAAMAFALSSKEPSYLYGAFSFGGMMAGFMSNLGKYVQSVVFLTVSLIVLSQSRDSRIIISGIYETFIAIIIFISLKNDFGKFFMGLFYWPQNSYKRRTLNNDIYHRLKSASDALFNIGGSLSEVSKRLTKIDSNGINKISNKVKGSICRVCGLKTLCWETRFNETILAFENINDILLNEKELNKDSIPKNLANRCCKIDDISKYISSSYREDQIRNASYKRILEVKSFVSEQFSDMGKILYDISNEYKRGATFDIEMAQRVTTRLKSLNIIPTEVICKYDIFNRFSLEIEVLYKDKDFLKDLKLDNILSKECLKKLDVPCITAFKDGCKIYMSEKSNFDVEVGSFQHTCRDETLCGDNYTYFNDGKGKMVFILSDGMGTGSRAAIEGAMACEIISSLIKAGIGFETAVRITNSCLFVKSEEESFATLDIVCIDLFTGVVDVIKGGAPLTLLKKDNNVLTLDLPSLPLGILKNINFICKKEILSSNDKILMISDGAIYPDEVWIESEVKAWEDEDSEEFAKRIVEKAVENRVDFRDDDITAIAIKFNKL